ncbi:MAG: inositol monophosphatase family protein [Chloroflexota bacterium]
MQPTLNELVILARQAGVILLNSFGNRHTINHKGVIDLVTDVDQQSERFLLDAILDRYPSHKIIAEESGGHTGHEDHIWYVDPLDGTVNYAHGVPIFSVSIAFAEQGRTLLGVVYDPMQDECFSAERSRGAWLNGKPIRASNTKELDQSLLVTGFPYDIRTNPENNLDLFTAFSLNSLGVRRLGSAALDLSYIAAGRFDGYWEIRLSPWDVAAGGLIAEEAGAIVTNLEGGPDYISPPQSVLAANPHVYPQMKALIQTLT